MDTKGEKARQILKLYKEGKTQTQIMRETGYSLAWIREVIARAKAQEGACDE